MERLLGLAALHAHLDLAQGAMDCRREGAQPMLQDKIGRAALQGLDGHFLAKGTRHEDERDFGRFLFGQCQSRKAIEGRQSMIGEYYRRFEPLQFLQEGRLGVHPFELEAEPTRSQMMLDQSRIMHKVFDHQNAKCGADKPVHVKTELVILRFVFAPKNGVKTLEDLSSTFLPGQGRSQSKMSYSRLFTRYSRIAQILVLGAKPQFRFCRRDR
jgi:hypothetical protein